MEPREPGAGSRESGGEGGVPEGIAASPPRPDRREAAKILQFTAVFLTAVVAFAFVAVLVLSSTDWGRERVRRYVLGQLQGFVHGQVSIGRVRGNLLTGATIDAFAIRDSAGQPFVAAEQVSARYSILELITRKIDLRAVKLVRPLIVLDNVTSPQQVEELLVRARGVVTLVTTRNITNIPPEVPSRTIERLTPSIQ